MEVQRQFRIPFHRDLPTRRTIAPIKDKFDSDETVHDVHGQRSGRPRTSISAKRTREEQLLKNLLRSPMKSVRRSTQEIGIQKSSVHRRDE